MKDKALLALLVGVGLAAGQEISIVSLLQKRKVDPIPIQKLPLPENCNMADLKNVCLECFSGYDAKEGLCVKAVVGDDEDDMAEYKSEFKEGFLPCLGKDSCGQAQTFRTQKQFSDFVAKFTSQAQYPVNNIREGGGMQFDQMQTIAKPTVMPMVKPMAMMTVDSMSFSGMSAAKIPSSPSPAPQPAADRDFSGTNNQVQGVDQADLLKTDGTYIYTISNKMLSIILAYPANKASVISKIKLGTLNAEALFIEGNFLSLFGTDYSTGRAFTFIRIYDVSNRAQPFLARTFKVQGRYLNGRKTNDGFVYLITSQSLYYRISPWYDFGLGKKIIPFTSIFRYPINYIQPQLTNIISFNLGKPTSNDRRVVSICGQTSNIMYMSQRHIYLTSTSWVNGQDYTNIRKIFVWRKYIVPFADGKVEGTINNQFSMDEYGPYLRVATTSNNGGKTQNNLFALGYYLKRSGELRGIAPGERIFSARFVERKLYLVTFRQVDPFFVISFANHKKPKILGQLKITGFSRYLHPYDDQTIIGFGREADENGRQKGLKIALYDVSDVANPKQIDSTGLKQNVASSNAEWEHKAFLFSLEKNMLVIPTSLNEGDSKFNGALIFGIDKETGIKLKKIVNHVEDDADNFYMRNVERSLYIEQLLYTKSKCLLKINDINQEFDEVKSIKIPCDQAEPIIRYPIFSPILPRPIPIPMPMPIEQPFPVFRLPMDRLQPISEAANAI